MDEQATCPVCGATFTKTRDWHKFDKDACRIIYWRDKWIRKRPLKPSEIRRMHT